MLTCAVVTVALFFGRAASAQFFLTEFGYDSASFSIATLTFNGSTSAQNGFTSYGAPGSLNVGGVAFTSSSNSGIFVIGPNYVGGAAPAYNVAGEYNFPGDHTATLDVVGNSGTTISLTATLPTGVTPSGITAFGTDIASTFVTGSITATVLLSDNTTQTLTFSTSAADTGLSYLGYDAPMGDTIESVTFTDSTASLTGFPGLVLDDFTYGVGADPLPTPEPATLSLLALGGLTLLWFRRRLSRS